MFAGDARRPGRDQLPAAALASAKTPASVDRCVYFLVRPVEVPAIYKQRDQCIAPENTQLL